MTKQNISGNVRSVKIFDDSKKGEIILRTTKGEIKLKLSDDHDSAFSGMAAVASAAVQFGNIVTPNVNVKYDADDMEIDEITFIQSKDACPVAPGACVPVSLGSKPKQSMRFKLDKLLSNIHSPSAIGAAYFHLARRYLAGKDAANDFEENVFNIFRNLPPNMHRLLACALDSFDSLTIEERNRLVVSDLLGDIDKPIDSEQLTRAITKEIADNVIFKVFNDPRCTTEEIPGLVRTQPNIGETPPSPVLICTINDRQGELHPLEAGQGVVISGMNFSHIDTKVRFTDKATGNARQVDSFVCGDAKTPLTDPVTGKPIIDCRVEDRLIFAVPEDMAPGDYFLDVLVPNPDLVGGWPDPLNSFSKSASIRINPTARFQISSETLRCHDETHLDFLGSDEVGISIHSAAAVPSLDITKVSMSFDRSITTQRFGDVDSTDPPFDMNLLLFSHDQPILGVSLVIKGYEIDGEGRFEDEIITFWDSFKKFLEESIGKIWDSEYNEDAPILDFLLRLVASIALGPIAITIGFFFSLWAPADPIITDAFGLTFSELFDLTNTNVPLPEPYEYNTVDDIKVKVTPLEKTDNQYRERRDYFANDEGSHYEIVLRYNRVA